MLTRSDVKRGAPKRTPVASLGQPD
jgi:hypothetical protein